ncbi:hypothetical protein GY45DRAFT_1372940 [Cubamyces sp. BRFM 1775]|nr:hypothetical protein GY45DRAFT_1372940 [Cubamyces sp. BRFM 1775]
MAQNAQVIHVGLQVRAETVLSFNPSSVYAPTGSIVTFVFDSVPSNHSVVQSSFENPCQPLDGGFASGFIVVPTDASAPFPTWNLTIESDAESIWFYCAQTQVRLECEGGFCPDGQLSSHCEGGMVGVINFNAGIDQPLASFESKAKAQTVVGKPTEPALSGVNALATALPGPLVGTFSGVDVPTGTVSVHETVAHTIVSPSGVSTGNTSGSHTRARVPVGTIVDAVVGAAAAVTIACVAILYILRQRRRRADNCGDTRQRYLSSPPKDLLPNKLSTDVEEAVEAARDPIGFPRADRPPLTLRYYDPDDPSTYPPSLPSLRRGRTWPIQPVGIPEVYGTP